MFPGFKGMIQAFQRIGRMFWLDLTPVLHDIGFHQEGIAFFINFVDGFEHFDWRSGSIRVDFWQHHA